MVQSRELLGQFLSLLILPIKSLLVSALYAFYFLFYLISKIWLIMVDFKKSLVWWKHTETSPLQPMCTFIIQAASSLLKEQEHSFWKTSVIITTLSKWICIFMTYKTQQYKSKNNKKFLLFFDTCKLLWDIAVIQLPQRAHMPVFGMPVEPILAI